MKKTLLLLIGLLLFVASCSRDESGGVEIPEQVNHQSGKIRWYGAKLNKWPQTRGVADGAKLWNQDAGIYVKFLNAPSDPQVIEKVKLIAAEWEEYADIKFHFVDQSQSAPVRIAFDWNGNDWLTWSYTGTDAKYERNQSQPTAVLAGVDYLTEEELRGDVLRLFGQILGLEYEQRHQEWSQNGYWRGEVQLQSYWESQFDGMNMDWDEIREYVFVPLTDENALQLLATREIDELSIMAWPYYNRQQTTNLLANYELSEGDKEFIALLYPPTQTLPTIQEAWVDPGYFTWTDSSKTRLLITPLGAEQEYLPDVCDGEQLTSAHLMFYVLPDNPIKLRRAPKFNTCNITDFYGMFSNCTSLTEILSYNTSKGTNFQGMFSHCQSLTGIPELDTSQGVNFICMFYYCSLLTSVPHLDTSNGTDFMYMFSFCESLTGIPHLNTSKGINFRAMFDGCFSLTSLPHLDTSNGVDFSNMLSHCFVLKEIPLLDTSNGTNFHQMFLQSALTTIPLLNTSNGVDFSAMVAYCGSLTTIPLIDTSNGIDFNYMFFYCHHLTGIPHLDTSNGVDFSEMFSRCHVLTSIPHLDTSKGTDFQQMFYACTYLTGIPTINTSNGTDFSGMFNLCYSLATMPQLDLSNATNTDGMFTGTPFE